MTYTIARCVLFATTLALANGCGVGVQPLMPTPAVFSEVGALPLVDVPPERRWTPRRVFYATTRQRTNDKQRVDYGNRVADQVSMGMAIVGFGDYGTTWADLDVASRENPREQELDLEFSGVVETSRVRLSDIGDGTNEADETGWLRRAFNESIEETKSGSVLIFVHGAKVNFYNACVFAAQLDHFMGRDTTPVAFSWPTRQNIVSYGLGGDVQRAYEAAPALAMLIEMIAERSPATRIDIVCWSAGARVTSRALDVLAERTPGEARKDLRIGTVYFAAGDVPRKEFIPLLPDIHDLADRVVVSVSSNDSALRGASAFMGGGLRIGQTGGTVDEKDSAMLASLERLEIVNVSLGSDERGFDITGHRYWFDHPWASSDLVVAVSAGLAAADRGLVASDHPSIWALPADYPAQLRDDMVRLGRVRPPGE